jgi:hypothetical protein
MAGGPNCHQWGRLIRRNRKELMGESEARALAHFYGEL